MRGYNRKCFDLYPSETILGWRVIRKVSFAEGDLKVTLGAWREVYDEFYNHVGYQIGGGANSVVMPSRPSPSGIVRREMEINALGVSRTARLNEDRRMSRVHHETGKALPPEDAVERIQAKVRVWPNVDAAAKDILRVWPR